MPHERDPLKKEKNMTGIKGTMDAYIEGFDWGCGVTKLYLHLDSPLAELKADDVRVLEKKKTTDFTDVPAFPVIDTESYRTVLGAYLVDEEGRKTEDSSKEAVITMAASPSEGSPLLFNMHTQFNTWSDPYELHISIKGQETEIDPVFKNKTTSADMFKEDTFKASDGISYRYVHFEPEGGSDVTLVWLHGLGEGGTENTDPYVTVLANKAAVFAQENFQKNVAKVNVLSPQCPTYWMDNDGKKGNFKNMTINADNTSYYTDSLLELIEKYKALTGSKKVILAGCSNGGFMTMVLTIARPDLFDLCIPVCEALADKDISNEDIAKIKDKPLYFVYSADDTTVPPEKHEIPTIRRLKEAGASDLHAAVSEHVFDKSGRFFDKDGKPHQYAGHWSWIDMYNNDCDADGLKVFDFIRMHL